MSRALRLVAALVLAALLGLIGAGCGSSAPSETGTATARPPPPAAAPPAHERSAVRKRR